MELDFSVNGSEGRLLWDDRTASVTCPFEKGYIYRVFLVSRENELPLGVMVPEGGEFRLSKSSRAVADFLSSGDVGVRVERYIPGERNMIPLPFAFSRLERRKGGFSDEVLAHLSEKKDAFYCEADGRKYLVFEIVPGGECPFSAVLSVAVPVFYGGKIYGAVIEDEMGNIVTDC